MSELFLRGGSALKGDNTIPGVKIPPELDKLLPTIFQKCTDFGLDYFPTVIQMLTYAEMSEVAAYGGFPVRYPHWSFGMEYEELQHNYMYGMARIFEMVTNCSPCYLYCLNSNTLLDNVLVIAHALGHNHFFKNNVFFEPTPKNMMNKFANHGTRIRRYMARWGRDKVMEFVDHVLRISRLIDTSKAWDKREIKEVSYTDERVYHDINRTDVHKDHYYMESWMNPKKDRERQQAEIRELEKAEELEIFNNPTKDILGFIRDNAPLKPWQQDIVSMLWEESMYFAPQGRTKTLNEGFASWVDFKIMCEEGLAGLGQEPNGGGIVEYALHKTAVLGGTNSVNPYKLGFSLLCDIEERWNKGQFGEEWEACTNLQEKAAWDKKLGLGKKKVFEVAKDYDDLTAIMEFFTPEFCDKYEFFNWKREPNGDVVLEDREFDKIKTSLIQKYSNSGLPCITLADINHNNKGYLMLEHADQWKRPLYEPYLKPVMQSLQYFWKKDVVLSTLDDDGDEKIFVCTGHLKEKDVMSFTREEYDLILENN